MIQKNKMMSDKNTIKFQYYPGEIQKATSLGLVTLDQFICGTRNPKDKNIFARIQQAEIDGNKALKQPKQGNLYAFTPCVHVGARRKYADIQRFTGLLVLDFDHLESRQYSIEFEDYLFTEYQYIIAAWVSPSGHGVKCLVNIPTVTIVDEFKGYYFGISKEVEQYTGFDDSGQNAVLPLFQGYDPKLMYRDNATQWTGTTVKSKAKPQATLPPPSVHIIPTNTPKQLLKSLIRVLGTSLM